MNAEARTKTQQKDTKHRKNKIKFSQKIKNDSKKLIKFSQKNDSKKLIIL